MSSLLMYGCVHPRDFDGNNWQQVVLRIVITSPYGQRSRQRSLRTDRMIASSAPTHAQRNRFFTKAAQTGFPAPAGNLRIRQGTF